MFLMGWDRIDPRAMGGSEIEQKEKPGSAGFKSKTQIATCGRYSPAARA